MGFDLKPIDPSPEAPTDKDGVVWGRYNIAGWTRLQELLRWHNVPTHELSWFNDHEVISNETCRKIADAIEDNLNTMSEQERAWLEPHIELWRTCGGYEIW